MSIEFMDVFNQIEFCFKIHSHSNSYAISIWTLIQKYICTHDSSCQ